LVVSDRLLHVRTHNQSGRGIVEEQHATRGILGSRIELMRIEFARGHLAVLSLAMGLLPACGGGYDGVCEVEAIALEAVPPETGQDCGTFLDPAADESTRLELVAARDCILSAIADRRSFRHVRGDTGFEGSIIGAFIGVRDGEEYELRAFGGIGEVRVSSCSDLEPVGPDPGECVASASLMAANLCLQCIPSSESELFCTAD
jgi:hypothetical protein